MKSKKFGYLLLVLAVAVSLVSCSVSLPETYEETADQAPCVPYSDGAVIPPNIAPMNFYVDTDAEDYVAWIHSNKWRDGDIKLSGPDMIIPEYDWHELLSQSKGGDVLTDIYVSKKGKWIHYPTITYHVAQEDIDPYISYRLIEPSYVTYEGITLNERNITNFDEDIIYSNSHMASRDEGQCVNCHNYQDHNRKGNMQFHLREKQGGTIIVYDGDMRKVNLKTDSTMSAGVYPAWHPSLPIIAYSVNATGQVFHTRDVQKVEVIDFGSDMILYDIKANKVYTISDRKDEYETFPAWSPDGKYLYYTSAHYEQKSDDIDAELDSAYQSLKYNIYRRAFNPDSMRFGEEERIFDAAAIGKSASLPRISPDGRYLLFGIADFGNFHIWHKSSDLAVLDLTQPAEPKDSAGTFSKYAYRLLTDANSPSVDSYHSWSDNGRWMAFSSRRDDDNYSRIYISYFDKSGKAHRPFILPQKDPHHYMKLFKSFNVPELMVMPVDASRPALQQLGAQSPTPATYAGRCTD